MRGWMDGWMDRWVGATCTVEPMPPERIAVFFSLPNRTAALLPTEGFDSNILGDTEEDLYISIDLIKKKWKLKCFRSGLELCVVHGQKKTYNLGSASDEYLYFLK
uniref:Uncharacterized protein n=1 Tax=Oryza brachyantha TaxID=4533 RepID=J3L668_ORYBR